MDMDEPNGFLRRVVIVVMVVILVAMAAMTLSVMMRAG